MEIKKYSQFIKEDKESIGEWIESVYDDYVLNLVSKYTQDIDTSIRLANAIDILPENQKQELYSRVKEYLDGVEPTDQSVEVSVGSGEVFEGQETIGGRNVFKSFLKIITALGLKENNPDWANTPKDYLIYYLFGNVDISRLKLISSRYKSISYSVEEISYKHNKCNIYFGIKTDLTFEYGIRTDEIIKIGAFKLNKTVLNWILILGSPSANSLRKEIVNLDFNALVLFSKIKSQIDNFDPGYFTKKSVPKISNGVMTVGYYGFGKWESGKLNSDDYQEIKEKLTQWLSNFRWSDKILFSVTSDTFWVYLNFKLKS